MSPAYRANEFEILSFLNSPELRASPDNHTIPLLEFIESEEGWPFIVMPAWVWTLETFPKLWHVDDCFAIIIQCLEVNGFCNIQLRPTNMFTKGLSFMHEHGVAHSVSSQIRLVR